MLEEKNDNLQNNAEGEEQINHETATQNDVISTENNASAIDAIEKENAEDNEENNSEKLLVPEKNYESFSPKELVEEFNNLLSNYKVTAIKEPAESIKKAYLDHFNEVKNEKFELFKTENPDAFEGDFDFNFETKPELETVDNLYKNILTIILTVFWIWWLYDGAIRFIQ